MVKPGLKLVPIPGIKPKEDEATRLIKPKEDKMKIRGWGRDRTKKMIACDSSASRKMDWKCESLWPPCPPMRALRLSAFATARPLITLNALESLSFGQKHLLNESTNCGKITLRPAQD